MKKLFILTACVMIITGCNGLINQEKENNITPPLGTIDVTEIKVGSHTFSKDRNLDLLIGTTLTVSKNPAEISVKASNVSETAGIKINGQELVPFTGGEAKQTISVSNLTAVKLEIFDTAKQTLVYSFKIKEQEAEKIELISYDSNTLDPDGENNYIIKLLTGSQYQIKTKVLPENTQNSNLSFSVPDEWKKYIAVSETGMLTVLEKPSGSNKPYVRIESTNGVGTNLSVTIDNQAETIIQKWELTGDGVDTSNGNNRIHLSQGEQGEALVKITKRSPYVSYKYKYDSNHIEMLKIAVDDTTDQYEIKIKQNKTVWNKNSSISFYIEEYQYEQWKWKLKEISLQTITITQAGNREFSKEIRWVNGVDEPSLAELSKRKPFEYAEWYESDTTKWFGVRKVSYTTDTNYNDTRMCWAITASNMLHWWFTQNKNEIAGYKQKNNISESHNNILYYNNNYHRGAVNDEKTKSSFASLLRLGFKNDGNPVQTALTWYLEGRDWGTGATSIQNIKPRVLFEGVLSSENSIVSMASLNNQNDINTLFKQAIDNNEAVAVSYELGGGNYPRGHVVTVWGISVDGDGNVFELWVADSDVGSNSKIPYIYNMGIHYSNDGRPKMVNLSTGKAEQTGNKFSDITTLKLGKDRFK